MARQEIEKKLWKWMCLGLIASLILGFGLLTTNAAHGQTGGTEVSGSLSEDITWTKASSPYVVTGNTTVGAGVILVIEPGVQVRFDGDYVLEIDGTLVARGTSQAPILFTSNQQDLAPGDWDDIAFGDSSVDYDPSTGQGCIMENVIVEYGGGAGQNQLVHIDAASPLIKDSVFRYGTAVGLKVQNGAAPIIEGNTFEQLDTGLRLSDGSNPTVKGNVFRDNEWAADMDPDCNPWFQGNTAEDNIHNGIRVSGGDTAASSTWYADLPYIPDGDITVPEEAVLTIEPGVQVRFDGDYVLGIDGTLVARGTPQAPILFTSNQQDPAPGDWDDIAFGDSSVDYDPSTGQGCIMENVIVEYGGGAGQNQLVHIDAASPLIKDSVFRYGTAVGLKVQNGAAPIIEGNTFEQLDTGLRLSDGSNPTVKGNVFRDNEWAADMDPDCNPWFQGNTAEDNIHNGIRVSGGDTAASSTWYADLPYIPDGDITVPEEAVLTIEPGVQVRFDGDYVLGIDGTLVARGTPQAPILFTSNQQDPAPGDWDDIAFTDTSADYDPSTGQGCIMENVILEYGGSAGGEQLLHIDAASPLIKDSVFRYGTWVGIIVENGAAPVLEANIFQDIPGEDIRTSEDSSPVIK